MIGEVPAVITTSKTGNVVLAPERFANAGELREVCQSMISADRPRATERADVDKQANGNPVYPMSWLKAKKQAWRARTNYRGLEGILSATSNIFYDLNVEVDPAIRVFLDYGEGDERVRWQECIARNYTRMILQQWPSFDFHIPLRDSQMLRHGLGAHVWPVKGKWEPHTPASGQILFPEDTSVDFHSRGESFMLREFTPAHTLYGYIRNEDAARKQGWNVEEVWKLLRNSSKHQTDESPEAFENNVRNNNGGTSKIAGVWLNYYFIVEMGDEQKISQYIIAEKDEGSGQYLFKKRNYFDDFSDVLVLFPYEIPANGLLHSIRGLGARTHEHFHLLNRIYNAMADNVLISMYPQFKQTGSADADKLKLMRVGAMTIHPQHVEAVSLNLPNLAQGGIPLSQMLTNSVNENNQNYMTGTPEPRDRETAMSFQMRAQDSARVSKATHSLYYRNLTRFHKKVLLTAIKPTASSRPWAVMAKELRERCMRDGVPEQAFSRIADVEAVRSVGAGSAAARLQAMSLLFERIHPTTTEDRKIAIERDFVSALTTYAQVDRYARNSNDKDTPDNDDTIAALENDAMTRGGEAVMNSKQNHVKHIQSHLTKAAEVAQGVQNGEIDPQQGLAALQALGQHIAQHLQELKQNPLKKREFESLHKEWLALGAFTDKLLQQVEEMMDNETPPPEQQLSEQGMIGMRKVELDAGIKQQKLMADAQRKLRQQAFNERIKDAQVAADINRKQLALRR